MTLTRLLETDLKFLRPEDERALHVAEQIWLAAGKPVERSKLADTLENILSSLVREGIGYPPFLLKRKKQLQRGEWNPREQATAAQGTCSKCNGFGYVVTPQKSAVACDCGAKWEGIA